MGGIVMMGGTIFNVDSTMCLDEIVRLLVISSGSYLLSGLNSYLSPYRYPVLSMTSPGKSEDLQMGILEGKRKQGIRIQN